MSRPGKLELLSRFFPEIRQKVSKSDKEQSIAYNTLACEVVLADLLRLFDRGLSKYGPGVLCVRLHKGAGESSFLALSDLKEDQQRAKDDGASDLESFFSGVITKISDIDPTKAGLVMLVDNSSVQLFPIDRDYPARSVQALLEEFAA
jgi:hypothetical protein